VSGASVTARAAAVAAAVIGVDQATKALVRAGIPRGSSDAVFPGVELVNVRNHGVAFGFLSDGGTVVAVVTGAALVALVVFFALNWRRPLAWLPVGLLLGGAAGNLIDRAREGAVTDFIDLPLWPAFNVADIAITIGVLALLYVLEGPPRRG
jgi:signal peptidase II